MTVRAAWRLGVLAVAGTTLVGCGPSIGRYDVRLELDDSLRSATPRIEVDLVALGGGEADQLSRKPTTDYFGGADPDRASYLADGELVQRRFGPGEPPVIVLDRSDPIWRDAWEGDPTLFILASVPGADEDGDRKLALPRSTDRWPDGSATEIVVKVRSDRLELETPLLPPP